MHNHAEFKHTNHLIILLLLEIRLNKPLSNIIPFTTKPRPRPTPFYPLRWLRANIKYSPFDFHPQTSNLSVPCAQHHDALRLAVNLHLKRRLFPTVDVALELLERRRKLKLAAAEGGGEAVVVGYELACRVV